MKRNILILIFILPFSCFAQIDWNTNSYSDYKPTYISPTSYDLPIIRRSTRNLSPCEKITRFVKSKSYGTTYTSYNSTAISKVTFYEVMIDYQTYYFAIVCFKTQYLNCSEYIYQVASNTKMYYSTNYLDSAGKAFWKYIQPYNENLTCAPDFD